MIYLNLKVKKYLLTFLILFSCSKDASEDIAVEIFQPEPVVPVVKYQLSVTAGQGGTVNTTGGEFASGSPVTVTATPNSGYSFVDWTGDGYSTSSSFTPIFFLTLTLLLIFNKL